MIHESIYTHYQPGVTPETQADERAVWFLFMADKLLVCGKSSHALIPTTSQLKQWGISPPQPLYLGTLNGSACYTAELNTCKALPPEARSETLRALFGRMEDGIFLLAGRALQVLNWHNANRFCGRCGSETEDKTDERAKRCPNCGSVVYPKLSPAIIVAVERGNTLLLGHETHFADNLYSVIAGYVEPGETLEDCVRRELREEVQVEVKNIRYFGSQPWPYTDSLMIAFTAEYAGGEIQVDGQEIETAGWYTVEGLRNLNIPNPVSVSRSLIEWFINKHGNDNQHK